MQPMRLLGLQNSGKPAEFELKLWLIVSERCGQSDPTGILSESAVTCTSDVRKPDREQFQLEIFVSTSSSPAILSEGRVRLQKQLTLSHSAPGKEGDGVALPLLK